MSRHRSSKTGTEFDGADVARFLSFVYPEPNSGCHLWAGAANKNGYGYFWCKKVAWNAHRFAYTIARGGIPAGAHVRHRCDNPYCMNPDHMELGTHADNMRDMALRDRSAAGERSGRRKLTADQVREIRNGSESAASIARRFNIGREYVAKLRRGIAWRGVQ